MNNYLYIKVLIKEPDPGKVSLFQGITEKALGVSLPDVIPPYHPSMVTFKHCVVEAESVSGAYTMGLRALQDEECLTWNDYVVRLP